MSRCWASQDHLPLLRGGLRIDRGLGAAVSDDSPDHCTCCSARATQALQLQQQVEYHWLALVTRARGQIMRGSLMIEIHAGYTSKPPYASTSKRQQVEVNTHQNVRGSQHNRTDAQPHRRTTAQTHNRTDVVRPLTLLRQCGNICHHEFQ